MYHSEIDVDEHLGYVELFVPIKVKVVSGYGTEQDLKSVYNNLVDCGEITQYVEEYLLSKVVGEHSIGINDSYIDKLNILVEEM